MKDKNEPPASVDGDPIVQGLRRLYDSVASEPVPAEFMDILRLIDQALAEEPDAARPATATMPDEQIIAFPTSRDTAAVTSMDGDRDSALGVARDAAARP